MRAKFLHGAALWTFLFAATLTTGCSDDNDYKDVDGQKPVVELIADHIHVDPGSELTLTATITDADGIRSIRLQNAELYLGEFYQFNLSSCIRQQNSLTAQFVSFSLSNLANIFYPPQFLQ